MKRRDVLVGTAAVGVSAAVAGPGCIPAMFKDARPKPEDMDAFFAGFDRGVKIIDDSRFVEGFAKAAGVTMPQAELQRREDLCRRMLRSLFVTTTFCDLPVESQVHADVQARMWKHAPELDQTLTEVQDMLASLDGGARERLRGALKAKPDLGMQLSEAIGDKGTEAGMSTKRRRQFRALMTQTTFRLRHAAPDVLIDEYVDKAKRVAAQRPSDLEMRRKLIALVGESAFWELQHRQDPGPDGQYGQPPSLPPQPRQRMGAGQGTIMTGLWMMGIAVVVAGVAGLIYAAGPMTDGSLLAVGVTVGSLLLLIGLICVIVGAIINSNEPV